MVCHHVSQLDAVLTAFFQMLLPGGFLAIADLDTEPGLFHDRNVATSVFHHGFDRPDFIERLRHVGLIDVKPTTAHVIRKPIAGGAMRDFSVFLLVGRRALTA